MVSERNESIYTTLFTSPEARDESLSVTYHDSVFVNEDFKNFNAFFDPLFSNKTSELKVIKEINSDE